MTPYFRAMKEDLTVARYPTFADLLHYMEGSALPVGRAMTYILGVRPPYTVEETLPHADSLSIAMQLSNFWRDIGPDWRIGRVYLPGEDLARFRVTEADLAAGRITPDFIALLEFEIDADRGLLPECAHRRAAAGDGPGGRDGRAGSLPGDLARYSPQRLRCLHPPRRHHQAAEARAGAARTAGGLFALRRYFLVLLFAS